MARKKSMSTHREFSITIDTMYNAVCDGYHNAFGDICLWKDRYYLAFRKAQAHSQYPPGNIVVLSSPRGDIYSWEHVATFDTGGDDRDPHFITYPDCLQLYWGTYYKRWGGKNVLPSSYYDLISCATMTRNGTAWATPWQIYRPGYWLWGTAVEPYANKSYASTYGMAYHFGADDNNSLHLLLKPHDKNSQWETVCTAFHPGSHFSDLSEPTVFFKSPEEMVCFARTDNILLKGYSVFPYTDWHWDKMDILLHAPSVSFCNGRWLIAGRTRLDYLPSLNKEEEKIANSIRDLKSSFSWSLDNKSTRKKISTKTAARKYRELVGEDVWRTAIYEFSPDLVNLKTKHLITLPSGGDNSYPGMFYDDEEKKLILQYYTQHQYPDTYRGIPMPADIWVMMLQVNNDGGV